MRFRSKLDYNAFSAAACLSAAIIFLGLATVPAAATDTDTRQQSELKITGGGSGAQGTVQLHQSTEDLADGGSIAATNPYVHSGSASNAAELLLEGEEQGFFGRTSK